jgi:hypothetical protein
MVNYRLRPALALESLALGSESGFGRAEALPAADFMQSAPALAAHLNDYRTEALSDLTQTHS